jgi:nucleoside triphosphate pyrophosphatase
MAGRGALVGAQARVSVPPAPPLLLASTSPQRTAILHQLRIPHDVVAPDYEEHDPPGADPVELVRTHAREKARSVADAADDRPVLAVDTAVVLGSRVLGKPRNAEGAFEMLDVLSGQTHVVVSGVCLRTVAWEVVEHAATRVAFRPLTPREIGLYLASGEWEGRAGGYAIQGLGASLVDEIEGDYLNVVGLPGALLVRLLADRFAGVYGFG